MNKHDRALLLGMAIGDGCLKRKARDYVEFCIAHSPKQLPYLEYKLEKFHSIVGGKKPKVHLCKHKLSNGKSYDSYRFSKQHKYFKLLRRWLYDGKGVKTITPKVLSYLNDEALAYWYMDDGSLTVNVHNDKVTSFEVRLYTYCTHQEALDIQEFFKVRYSINAKVSLYGKKGQYNIKFNTTEGRKFLELIEPYSIPVMAYKFDILSKTRVRNISNTEMMI